MKNQKLISSVTLSILCAAVGCGDDSDDFNFTESTSSSSESTDGDTSGTETSDTDATDTTDATDATDDTGTETGDGDGDGDVTTGDGDATTGDGDGDETTGDGDDTGGNPDCFAPQIYADCDGTPGVDLVTDPFQAIGLNCPGGSASNSIQVLNASMDVADPDSWAIVSQFGDATTTENRYNGFQWAAGLDDWTSPESETVPPNTSTAFLMLTSGKLLEPDGDGALIYPQSEWWSGATGAGNDNPDLGNLPSPMTADKGSNNGAGGTPFVDCDGIGDCSDTLYENWFALEGGGILYDKLSMSFDVVVPEGVYGYVFDFAYFTGEYPNYIGDGFEDIFIAWQSSEAYTGNVTFANGSPLGVTSLDAVGAFFYSISALELFGTGFLDAGATKWLTAHGGVEPGETANISFFVADGGDQYVATTVLLDNFRWACQGCIPSEIDDCGLLPE